MSRIILIILMFFSQSTFGQELSLSSKLQKKYDNAIEHIKKKNFDKALKDLNEVIAGSPGYILAYHKIVGIYYNQKDIPNSIVYLKKAIEKNPNYDTESYFSMATLYKENKEYGNATDYYKLYLSKEKDDQKRLEKAELYAKECDFRDDAMNNPLDITPQLLSGNVNSDQSEYMPSFTLDGEKIIFTRRTFGQEDLYIGIKDSTGRFSNIEPFEIVNTPYNEGMQTISADGKVIIYSSDKRNDTKGGFDLYFTFLGSEGWVKPRNIGNKLNSSAWDAQPSLSADGKTLYFSSTRSGGKGGRDLYYATLSETMSWSEPINMGNEINTSGNEEAPFIHPDGRTLYFTSDAHIGMGDSDIFMTKYNTQTQSWSIPKNLGFPINTEKSEGALSISLDGKTAYFASDQLNKDNARNLDVLYFELPEELKPEPLTFVKIHTISSQGINLSNVKFSLKDNNSGKEILSSFTDESANAIFSISPGLNYNLTFEKDGYAFTSKNIRLDSINQAISPYIMQVKLHKLEVEKTTETESIILNNLFFKTASAEISSESTIEIENLYQLLYDNTAISIKIIGHTDNVGNPDQNKILSEERAKSVKSALVQKGINTNRIFIEGKGEENPIADNETIEGREINRRTEFVILSN